MVATVSAGPENLRYRLLGPVQVFRAGTSVAVGPPKARALLAYLLLHAGEVIPSERLVDVLWGVRPPATATHALQVYIAGLRRVLEPDRPGRAAAVLRTRHRGYQLDVAPEQVDVHRFEALVGQGRAHAAAVRPESAVVALREGESLWNGPALADLTDEEFAGPVIQRLDELRLSAVEDRIDAELTLGRHAQVAGELVGLTAEHPTRERLHGQLMLAHYRCGRQPEALAVFRRLRTRLDEEGLVPSPGLRELELAVLRQAAELTPPPKSLADGLPPGAAGPVVDDGEEPGADLLIRKVTALQATFTYAGPEPADDLAEALAGAAEAAAESVLRFGGAVLRCAPDAVTAVFGARGRAEDDPERAVRAGLEIATALRRYADEIAAAWDVAAPVPRIGIATGSWPPGADLPEPDAAPVAVAVALATKAAAATVVVDPATRTLVTRRFRWADRTGPDAAADIVVGPAAGSPDTAALPRAGVPLVGRTSELAAGTAAIRRATQGNGGIVWIMGDAGVGKTRLLAELRERTLAVARPPVWLQGQCLPHGQGVAHGPIKDLLDAWLAVPPHAPELRVRSRMRIAVAALPDPDDADVRAGLADLLGLGPDGAGDDDRPQGLLAPEARHRRMATALHSVLDGLALSGALVIAVEDLHWGDSASIQLLESVINRTADLGITVIATHRPEHDHISWRLREVVQRRMPHRTTEIGLDRLPDDDAATLVSVLTAEHPLAAAVRARVLDTAEGNPFYLEELVHAVRTAPDGDRSGDLPATIEQVLGGRIGRLPAAAQHVIATAAVLGRRFRVDVLTELACLEAVPVDILHVLAERGLIVQTQGWPAAEFEFRHTLTHEAAYRAIWPPRRRELHRRAGEILQARTATTSVADAALARHWQLAEDHRRAFAAHRRAARSALRVHALDVAAHHFAAGLAAADRLGSDADPLVTNDLLLGLGQVGRRLGTGDPEAQLGAALAGAARTGDPVTEWQARYELGFWLAYVRGRTSEARSCFEAAARVAGGIGEVEGQVHALARAAMVQANELDIAGAVRMADAALRLADSVGRDRAVAAALDARKLCALYLGELGTFEDALPRLTTVLRRDNDLWTLQFVLAEAAVVAAATGRWSEAASRLARAEDLNRRCGDRLCSPLIAAMRGRVERSRGSYGTALVAGIQAVTAAVGGAWWGQWARVELAATLLEVHDVPAALQQLHAAGAAAVLPAQHVRGVAFLALACLRCGTVAEAARHLAAAEALLTETMTPRGRAYLFGADAMLACGEVRLAMGKPDLALALVEPVVGAAERSGWVEPWAAGLVAVARCRHTLGDTDAARRSAAQALDIAADGAAPAVSWRARAVLGGIGAPGAADLVRRARCDVVELAMTLDGPHRRTYLDGALTEIDRLAHEP